MGFVSGVMSFGELDVGMTAVRIALVDEDTARIALPTSMSRARA